MTEYQVSLDVYQGPLDLLLRLIEQQQLDITKVSLVLVTDQYLAHIARLEEVSAANLADFIVLAARLLVIKSRALLPRPVIPVDEDEEEDPGELLARQLLEYKRFKQVAQQLRNLEESGLRAYPRIAPPPQIETRLRPGDVTLEELAAAFRRALAAKPPTAPVDEVISPVSVRIVDCIQGLTQAVRRYPRVRLSTIIRRATSRMEVIVYFLAMLELIKQQRIRATQERPMDEIYLEAREPDPEADIQAMDLSEYGEGLVSETPAPDETPPEASA